MVRSELLQKMRDLYPNILSKDMEKIISIILSEINDALHRGQNFEARGFGSFKLTTRKARIGRNPKNSKPVEIPEKKAIKWKMSKILYRRLNKNFTENEISVTN